MWQGIRLHLDYLKASPGNRRRESNPGRMRYAEAETGSSTYSTVAAGAALLAALGVYALLRRARN